MKSPSLPNLLWYGNERRQIDFPDGWAVEELAPPGFKKPPLDEDGIARAIREPIGCPPLSELAERASEVCIVFDDITRPTPVSRVLPPILEILDGAGIPASNIRFIPALGMHGAMDNIGFRRKLGDEVLRKYPVYNHNPYENCEHLGKSPSGVPVYINREFISCDLRIGVGCITPHVNVGFGGGGKIVLPGISGVETIHVFHSDVMERDLQSVGLGNFDDNAMYKEVVDVVRMAGMQVKVDGLLNDRGEITDLFVGDPVDAHLAGVEVAKDHYGTMMSTGNDIVVTNAYGKYNEMAIAVIMAYSCVRFDGGTIVLVADAPDGQVCHYLLRSFGKEYGGRLYVKLGPPPEGVKLVVCTRYPDPTMCDLFAAPDSVVMTKGWEETRQLLERDHGDGASVAVIPDGTMQYFAS